jgi:hypothetical protein
MPVKNVKIYVCSICQTDQEVGVQTHQMKLQNGSGTLHYDICDGCMEQEPVATFLSYGEQRGSRVVVRTPLKARKTRPATKVAKSKRKGLEKCPDCDYSHALSRVIGTHRAREHGYVSPKKVSA